MKQLLSFLTILVVYTSNAQNYNCIQPERKSYFINKYNYLRGIRIDSVHTFTDYKVYYPYHTPRGNYDPFLGTAGPLNPAGGSWVGKTIIERTDGTFLFENHWHDTVVIKTQATVGESWIFYNDTTSRYYRAYLTAISTRLISGVIDSVKIIDIKAFDDSGYAASDLVNNFRIIISKHHGFSQLFDLYTFPYHEPNREYESGFDYFLDNLQSQHGPMFPAEINSIFYATDFKMPSFSDLYDWQPGDVFHNEVCLGSDEKKELYSFYSNTITARTLLPQGVKYDYSGWIAERHYTSPPFYPNPTYIYKSRNISGSFITNNVAICDSVYMPEEYNQKYNFFYHPQETTYHCTTSNFYRFYKHEINENMYIPYFEASPIIKSYKTGVGLVSHFFYITGHSERIDDTTLVYYQKGNTKCGKPLNEPVFVNDAAHNGTYIQTRIYPNPANNVLMIDLPNNGPYSISILSYVGQIVYQNDQCSNSQTIHTENLPTGLYVVYITDKDGSKTISKLSITH
jgi:hypothetical protein